MPRRSYTRRTTRSYARKDATKEPYETILILCEGEKSEPNYFNGLRRQFRLSNIRLVIDSGGSDPLKLVKLAEKELESGRYDKAFCIFDHDCHATFDNALQWIANSDKGKLGFLKSVTSIPCFEVWILLHFVYTTGAFTSSGGRSACDNVIRAVREHFPTYTKAHEGLFEALLPKLETAISYAKRLDEDHSSTGTTLRNPSTELHEFVDYLRKLRK